MSKPERCGGLVPDVAVTGRLLFTPDPIRGTVGDRRDATDGRCGTKCSR